jgi:hypothetical protein
MSFALNTVMDAIATEINTDITGTRVYGWPVPNPVPPCVIVGYPESLEYDFTFHAIATTGKVKAIFPVRYVVARVMDNAARDAISAMVTGAPGIPESLGGKNLAGTVDTCNVDSVVRFESERVDDIDYEVVIFRVEVIG